MNKKIKIGRNSHESSDVPEPLILFLSKLVLDRRPYNCNLGLNICLDVVA